MAYKKKTLKDFKNDLDSKTYESVAGARRAVGKFADWSEADRKSAHKLIDAYFGEAPQRVQTPTTRKPRPVKAKKGGKKSAAAAPTPPAAAVAPAATAPPKAGKGKKKQGRASSHTDSVEATAKTKAKSESSSMALVEVSNTLGTYEAALQNLETIKRIDSGFNVSAGLSEAHDGIRECLVRLRALGAPTAASPVVRKDAPAAAPAAPPPATSPNPSSGFATGGLTGLPGFAQQTSQG